MIEVTQQLATTGRRVKVQHEQFRLIRFNITLDKKSCLIIYKNLYIVLLRIELNLIKTCSLTNIFQVQLFCLLGLMTAEVFIVAGASKSMSRPFFLPFLCLVFLFLLFLQVRRLWSSSCPCMSSIFLGSPWCIALCRLYFESKYGVRVRFL
jgi:hypothetical protein